MIKWGVIGAGHMGKVFADAIKEVDNAELVAISSKDSKNLKIFGREFNIHNELMFNSYEEICRCKKVDAIYISTLNNTHLDLIALSAQNKKNILCEKPFCLDLSEAKEIEKILIENKVMFFEAIAYLSHPQTDQIFDLINNGEIGEIESIESSFGFKVRKIDPKSRLFNKELGGGAILDVGCYPLSFISLFDKKENEIKFKNIQGKICYTNVDIDTSADLLVNNRIKCKIKISLNKYFKNNSIINGTKGRIVVNSPWLPSKKVFLEVFSKERYYKTFINSNLSVYANQIKNISDKFNNKDNNESKLFDISKSLKNMYYLDYWKKNIK